MSKIQNNTTSKELLQNIKNHQENQDEIQKFERTIFEKDVIIKKLVEQVVNLKNIISSNDQEKRMFDKEILQNQKIFNNSEILELKKENSELKAEILNKSNNIKKLELDIIELKKQLKSFKETDVSNFKISKDDIIANSNRNLKENKNSIRESEELLKTIDKLTKNEINYKKNEEMSQFLIEINQNLMENNDKVHLENKDLEKKYEALLKENSELKKKMEKEEQAPAERPESNLEDQKEDKKIDEIPEIESEELIVSETE